MIIWVVKIFFVQFFRVLLPPLLNIFCAKVVVRGLGCSGVDSAWTLGSRGAAALCRAGAQAARTPFSFKASPLSCCTSGHVTHWLLGIERGAFVSLPSTDHHVSQEDGCWTRVWCPQIYRGMSLERTVCGRKGPRLRLLTKQGGKPRVLISCRPQLLCHPLLSRRHPSHPQGQLCLLPQRLLLQQVAFPSSENSGPF